MEEQLGVGLLRRHSRGVRPTAAGKALCSRARELLSLADVTEREVAAVGRSTVRSVRLGVPPSAARLIGIDALLRAKAVGGGFDLHLCEGFSCDLVAMLERGDLDFVLGCEVSRSPELEVLDLMDEELLFVTAREEFDDFGAVPLAEVLASDLVFLGQQDACWRLVLAAARSAGLPARIAHEVASIDLIRQMVIRGIATVVSPYGAFREEFRRGEVAVRAIENTPLLRRMSLVWRRAKLLSPDEERFVAFMVEVVSLLHRRIGAFSRLLVADQMARGTKQPAPPVAAGSRG